MEWQQKPAPKQKGRLLRTVGLAFGLLVAVSLLVLLSLMSRTERHRPMVPESPGDVSAYDPARLRPEVTPEQRAKARKMCSRVEYYVNNLADYTKTGCGVVDGRERGTIDLIILANDPVFLAGGNTKKGWLLSVIGAVGKEMTDHPDVPIAELSVTDTWMSQNDIRYRLSGELAKSLRNRLVAEQISLDKAYAELLEALERSKGR
jgi:hypothetical protein